ncbi:Basic proline-rich protein precursor [Actinomycetales bacterium JB111]|nr:Basic proline-rich protein precursor [Actinomycetales bacterium JB111]
MHPPAVLLRDVHAARPGPQRARDLRSVHVGAGPQQCRRHRRPAAVHLHVRLRRGHDGRRRRPVGRHAHLGAGGHGHGRRDGAGPRPHLAAAQGGRAAASEVRLPRPRPRLRHVHRHVGVRRPSRGAGRHPPRVQRGGRRVRPRRVRHRHPRQCRLHERLLPVLAADVPHRRLAHHGAVHAHVDERRDLGPRRRPRRPLPRPAGRRHVHRVLLGRPHGACPPARPRDHARRPVRRGAVDRDGARRAAHRTGRRRRVHGHPARVLRVRGRPPPVLPAAAPDGHRRGGVGGIPAAPAPLGARRGVRGHGPVEHRRRRPVLPRPAPAPGLDRRRNGRPRARAHLCGRGPRDLRRVGPPHPHGDRGGGHVARRRDGPPARHRRPHGARVLRDATRAGGQGARGRRTADGHDGRLDRPPPARPRPVADAAVRPRPQPEPAVVARPLPDVGGRLPRRAHPGG